MAEPDLHTRLRSAIEERLALAQAATPGPWRQTWMGEKLAYALGSDVECDDGSRPLVGRLYQRADALYVAANSPDWVIRACRADLARLEAHRLCRCDLRRQVQVSHCATHNCGPGWPCPEVRSLAEVWLEEVL